MLKSNRREFIQVVLSGAAGLTVSWPVFGQGPAPAPITAVKLTDRVVVLSGAGGNVGLVIGSDGLLMVDGGLANRAADLANAITEVSPRMVQVLFNTHYHFDHVGSNEYLGKNNVRIIAHENVTRRVGERINSEAFGRVIEPLARIGHPTETFTSNGKLAFGQEALEYTHIPLAHTDGDAYVFFPNANVLHTGDLLFVGRYPVVDFTVGGSLAAMAASLERMDRVGDVRTRVIPGHGPMATKADMKAAREMWLSINQRLEEHAKAGRPIDEVVKAAPTKEFDTKLGVTDATGFVRQAYSGVLATTRR
jgi:cyclase